MCFPFLGSDPRGSPTHLWSIISRLVSSHPQVVKCQLCLVSDSTTVKVFACLPSFLQLASFSLPAKLPEDPFHAHQFAFLSSSPLDIHHQLHLRCLSHQLHALLSEPVSKRVISTLSARPNHYFLSFPHRALECLCQLTQRSQYPIVSIFFHSKKQTNIVSLLQTCHCDLLPGSTRVIPNKAQYRHDVLCYEHESSQVNV